MHTVTPSDPVEQQPPRPLWVWLLFALLCGAFFLVQHDMRASLKFQTLTSIVSFEQLQNSENLSILFESTSARQIGGLAIGALGFFLILQRGRTPRRLNGTLALWIMFFIGWNLMSITWADDPSVTARRLILFLCFVLGAVAVGGRLTPRDIALFATLSILLWIGIGFYAEYRNHTFPPTESGYRFSGTLHPNEQAINCAILFFAGWYFFRTATHRRWPCLVLMAFALGMLYFTRSRTALASTIVAWAAFEAILITGPRRMAVVLGGLAAVVSVFLLSSIILPNVQETLTLGRTDVPESFGTLTGRLPLWEQLIEFAAERPILGYGYAGFWNEQNSMAVITKQEWPISHAHNAYLDILLETGPVGTLAFIVILLLGLHLCYVARRDSGERGYEFFGFVLAFAILNGLLESQVIQRTLLTFLVMSILAFVAVRTPQQAPIKAAATASPPLGRGQRLAPATRTASDL